MQGMVGLIKVEDRKDYLLAKHVKTGGESYLAPYYGRKDLISKYPQLKYSIPDYQTYSTLPARTIMPRESGEEAPSLRVECLRSVVLENTGPNSFEVRDLPWKVQSSPLHGIVSGLIDDDPYPEIVATGNRFTNETLYGWQDAGMGAYLQFEEGQMRYIDNQRSGLFLNRDERALTTFLTNKKEYVILSGANSDSLSAVSPTSGIGGKKVVRARPEDMFAKVKMGNGTVYKKEFYYGSGYYSQSQRFVILPNSADSVRVYSYDGSHRTVHP